MNNPTPSKKPVGRPPHPATIRVRKLLLRHKASGGFKDRSFYVNKLLDEGTISYSVCHSIVTREMRRAKKVRVAQMQRQKESDLFEVHKQVMERINTRRSFDPVDQRWM